MTVLLELRGVVEAAPDLVAELLLDVRPGGRSPLAFDKAEPADGDEFVVTRDGSRLTVKVNRAERSVSQQGEWWYRGVTSVEPDPRGSMVVHRVFNVAPQQAWAVRFVSRGPLNAAHSSFAAHLQAIGNELGVAAWPIDS
jgi:hypothetical protein